jgi:Ca2+-binding RTX toxin-like protein
MSNRKLMKLLVVAFMVVALVVPATTAGAVPGAPVQLSLYCNNVKYDPTNPAHEAHPTATPTFVDGALDPKLPLNVLYLVIDRSDATGDTWTFVDSTPFSLWPSWGGHVYFKGSKYNDTACLGFGSDVAMGYAGDDLLAGEWGDGDRLYGGTGKDTIHTGFTFADLAAGVSPIALMEPADFPPSDERADVDDSDRFYDAAYGGSDDDTVVGNSGFAGTQLLIGGSGNDQIWGGGGQDVIRGNKGDDLIYSGLPYEILLGQNGPIYEWWLFFFPLTGPDARQLPPWLIPPILDTWIFGGAGNDQIFTNACSLELFGHSNYVYGNAGDDVMVGQPFYEDWITLLDLTPPLPIGAAPDGGCSEFMNGGPGADNIWGGGANDELRGGNGNDVIYADSPTGTVPVAGGFIPDNANDKLSGNNGDDQLFGDFGADFALGGDGNDVIKGSRGGDELNGGKDSDIIWGESGVDFIFGKSGGDFLYQDTPAVTADARAACVDKAPAATDVGAGPVTDDGGYISGGPGGDQILGDCGPDEVDGGGGGDVIRTVGGPDGTVDHGNPPYGPAILLGAAGVNGGPGDDDMDLGSTVTTPTTAGAQDGIFDGGPGNDKIVTGIGDDYGTGGSGNDTISTGKGDDGAQAGAFPFATMFVDGGTGDDVIDLGDGDDVGKGNDGDDTIDGGKGDDYLFSNLVQGADGVGDPDLDVDHLIGGLGDDFTYGGCQDLDSHIEGTDLAQQLAAGVDTSYNIDLWTVPDGATGFGVEVQAVAC